VLLAIFWSFFYEAVWHAVVHALFAGMAAHLVLQLMVTVAPKLPFAAEPRKAERSTSLFVVLGASAFIAGIFPWLLHVVYQRGALVIVTFAALMAGLTAVLEIALRMRVNEAIGDLEFQS